MNDIRRAGNFLSVLRTLPFADLREMVCATPALILAPHADDESLGCGGLIAESCVRCNPPIVVVVTDGTGSHPGSARYPAARLAALRESEARNAADILGLPQDNLFFMRLKDTAAPHYGAAFHRAVAWVVAKMDQYGCRTIYAPWRHDPHCDHLATHLMARAAAANIGARHFSYPVWGWTIPEDTILHEVPAHADDIGVRLDIRRWQSLKRRAIAAHVSQTTGLIEDAPDGFRLKPEFLSVFGRPYEVFLQNRP